MVDFCWTKAWPGHYYVTKNTRFLTFLCHKACHNGFKELHIPQEAVDKLYIAAFATHLSEKSVNTCDETKWTCHFREIVITLHHLGSLRWTFANIICSFLRQGKMSVSPRPKANGLFSPLFSLSKNWIHHEVWGCAELIPASRRIRIPQSKSPSGHKPLGSNLLADMDPRNPQMVMDPCRWFRPPLTKLLFYSFLSILNLSGFFSANSLSMLWRQWVIKTKVFFYLMFST